MSQPVSVAPETDWVPRYCETRTYTEALADPLNAEDQTVQSMPDVSPTKWHRAHTTWFFEEFVLGPHRPGGYEPYHPQYGYLFNSYYEAVGDRHPRPERGLVSRPGVKEVGAYRRAVDEAMVAFIASGPSSEVLGLVELGINHEQQHQELVLMDIKHVLSQNPLDPAYRVAPVVPAEAPALAWLDHAGGLVDIGADGEGFSFDNESPRHTVMLRPFQLASRPVTNGEWLAFIADGGYQRAELWLSDGWGTVQAEGWEAPLYWRDEGGDWSVFTLAGRRAVDPAEPVCHVSYYEADAFARWAGARLPLEAEWEAVAASLGAGQPPGVDLGVLGPRLTPIAPDDTMLLGGVWEWTGSPYTAYPGFRPGPGAIGEYNGKFMVNQQVLRGGACVTPPRHARVTYRNFFTPRSRWVFSGVRLARDVA